MLVLYGRISQLMLLMHACLRYVLKIKELMYTVNHKKTWHFIFDYNSG